MGNILVLGVGPLPPDGGKRLYAPGLRTWHMARMLVRAGHHVTIGVIEFGDFAGGEHGPFKPRREEAGHNIVICRLRYHERDTASALATLHVGSRFSCLVSTTDIMNAVAAAVPFHVPLWLDYNGDPFAEKQLQGELFGNDATLFGQWKLMLPGLLAGDRFSTASRPQKWALIGQLGFAGRLNQFAAGEELVHAMPNCSRAMLDVGQPSPRMFKGRLIPADSIMILWSGGYNTWCDPRTLFHGLEAAMRKNPRIFFISTGGEISGHNTSSFTQFRELVEGSDLQSRFILTGWRPLDEIPSYFREADAAIVADRPCYEGELGARTRINDWILHELPVITTSISETNARLAREGLVTEYEPGNSDSLAAAIIEVAADLASAKAAARRAKEFFDNEYGERKVFEPLLTWADQPVFAGDRRESHKNVPLSAHERVDCALARIHIEQLARAGHARHGTARQSFMQRLFGAGRHKT